MSSSMRGPQWRHSSRGKQATTSRTKPLHHLSFHQQFHLHLAHYLRRLHRLQTRLNDRKRHLSMWKKHFRRPIQSNRKQSPQGSRLFHLRPQKKTLTAPAGITRQGIHRRHIKSRICEHSRSVDFSRGHFGSEPTGMLGGYPERICVPSRARDMGKGSANRRTRRKSCD
jgi:hypothetical protein